MIASAAAPIAGGIIGNLAAKGDREAAEAAYNSAIQEIMQIGAPPDLSKEIILQKFAQAGVLTPELEENIDQLTSATAQIQEDVKTKQRQVEAADILAKRGRGGFTLEDRSALDKIRETLEGDYQAKQRAIQQQMQARGVSGSGQELAMMLQSASDTANRASQEGIDLGALATQRALQSMTQAGDLASRIRTQDLDYQRLTKGAQDELNRFNVQGRRDTETRNIAALNRARQYNIQQQQRAADANVTASNKELYRQSEARRQYWLDQVERAKMRSGALKGQSEQYAGNAARTAGQWQSIGSGVGAGLGSFANYQGTLDQRAHERSMQDQRMAYDMNSRSKKLGYDPFDPTS